MDVETARRMLKRSATGRRALALALVLLLPPGVFCASAIAQTPPRSPWFQPRLVQDDDVLCAPLLATVRAAYLENQGLERPGPVGERLSLRAVPLPEPQVESDDAPDAGETADLIPVDGYPVQFRLRRTGRMDLYVAFPDSSRCGGACSASRFVLSDKRLERREDLGGLIGASTDEAGEWQLFKSADEFFVIGSSVGGPLLAYRVRAPGEFRRSCQIAIEPSIADYPASPAFADALRATDTFHETVSAMTGVPGDCGTAQTPGRWKGRRHQLLREALARPWALKRADGSDRPVFGTWRPETLDQRLELWSLADAGQLHRYESYLASKVATIQTLTTYYQSAFGYDPQTGEELARNAIEEALSQSIFFRDRGPYELENEIEWRRALAHGQPVERLREISFEGLNATELLPAAVTHPDALTLLIERGANVNAVNEFGKTVLMYAAQLNQLRSVRILLAAGAAPNSATFDPGWSCDFVLQTFGMTALHYAVRYASPDVVRLLVSRGAATFNPATTYDDGREGGNPGYPLDWLNRFTDANGPERNPNINENQRAELRRLLELPDARNRASISNDLRRRALKRYNADDFPGARDLLRSAVNADPGNMRAREDLQLAAGRMGNTDEALSIGNDLVKSARDPGVRARAWFNIGVTCKDQRFVQSNGRNGCTGDTVLPFLASWVTQPNAARQLALRELFQSPRTCMVGSGDSALRIRSTTGMSDVPYGSWRLRVYVLHAPGMPVASLVEAEADRGRVDLLPIATYSVAEEALTVLELPGMNSWQLYSGATACKVEG